MPMNTGLLLERIQTGDPKAFTDLSDAYGWDVYSGLASRIRDRDAVNLAYTEIMMSLYTQLREGELQEDIDSFLQRAVKQYCDPFPDVPPAEEKPAGAGFWIALVLLLALNAVCLWLIVGILMEMGILPTFDLGYSWLKSILFH